MVGDEREDCVLERVRIGRPQPAYEPRQAMVEPRQVGSLVIDAVDVARVVDGRQVDGDQIRDTVGMLFAVDLRGVPDVKQVQLVLEDGRRRRRPGSTLLRSPRWSSSDRAWRWVGEASGSFQGRPEVSAV